MLSLNKDSDRRLKLLEYKIIDMEARSRMHKLMFRGHSEVVGDNEAMITSFLRSLNIKGVEIQRAHQIGNPIDHRSDPYILNGHTEPC